MMSLKAKTEKKKACIIRSCKLVQASRHQFQLSTSGSKDLVSVVSLTANLILRHWVITSLWASRFHFTGTTSSGPPLTKTLSKLFLSYRNTSLRIVGETKRIKKKTELLEKVKILYTRMLTGAL